MRCPTLKDLPLPPEGKKGWPWTVESPQLSDIMPDDKHWPKISIVTPSFNQGKFIEETIRSILLQGYPNLEYIIIDGGSTDEAAQIIKKYEPWLDYWISESDAGQANAINKGLLEATGDWFNWINSDDLLTPSALFEVASCTKTCDAVAGATANFDSTGQRARIANAGLDAVGLTAGSQSVVFHQPSLWLRLSGLRECGGINSNLHYVFDWEMIIRYLASHGTVSYTSNTLAHFRLHDASKTVSLPERFETERLLALALLRDHCVSAEVRAAADLRYRHKAWSRLLETQIQNAQTDRWWAMARIMLMTLQDPTVRLSRMTFGAIKQALRSGVRKNV